MAHETSAAPRRPAASRRRAILVTGATGYIGGRLVPHLLSRGHRVRCLVRDRRKLSMRSWVEDPGLEVLEGDVGDDAALGRAMDGCSAAYFLVHSMIAAGERYQEIDRSLARAFSLAAERARLEQIIYLGGLGETGERLSEHLRSRREVELELASGTVPVTVLRAAMIIGAGSASFEILRYLVERLPAMLTPRWVSTECQPIAIRDALHYLVAALETPEVRGRTLDIGGADVLTYRELMTIMARALDLPPRVVIPVPILSPRLSSLWIHLVTPVSAQIARPLTEGLRNRVVCRDAEAARLMPTELLTARAAVDAALRAVGAPDGTSWLDVGPIPGDPGWAGGTVFRDERRVHVEAPRETVFEAAARVGGRRGWYAASWLWRARGAIDRMAGGPGLSRGRRRESPSGYGDVIDFWRVTDVRRGERLELRAEMKLPGTAQLTFSVEDCAEHRPTAECTLLTQTARFKPRGLLGLAYWFAVLPFHGVVFRGMIHGLRAAAEAAHARTRNSRAGTEWIRGNDRTA